MKAFLAVILFCFGTILLYAQESLDKGLPQEVDSVLKISRLDSLHRTIYWYKHDPNYHPMVNLKDSSLFVVNAFDLLFKKKSPSIDFYQGHEHKVFNAKTIPNAIEYEDGDLRYVKQNWEIYYLVLLVIYFVFIRNRFYSNMIEIIDANWSNRFINHYLRDENFFKLRSSVFFILFFILGFSFFVYLVNKEYTIVHMEGNWVFLRIIFYVSIFYFVRFHLVKLLNFVFDLGKLFNGYNTIFYIGNIFFTLIILPILIFIPFVHETYAEVLLIISILIFFLFTGYKYIRTAIYLLFQFQFSIFYLFVYLCTLEIAPILVLIKLITDQNDKIG